MSKPATTPERRSKPEDVPEHIGGILGRILADAAKAQQTRRGEK